MMLQSNLNFYSSRSWN